MKRTKLENLQAKGTSGSPARLKVAMRRYRGGLWSDSRRNCPSFPSKVCERRSSGSGLGGKISVEREEQLVESGIR